MTVWKIWCGCSKWGCCQIKHQGWKLLGSLLRYRLHENGNWCCVITWDVPMQHANVNRIGPSTEPWGTQRCSHEVEKLDSAILIHCLLCHQCPLIALNGKTGRCGWTMSNAALRPTSTKMEGVQHQHLKANHSWPYEGQFLYCGEL